MKQHQETYVPGVDPAEVHRSVVSTMFGTSFRISIDEPWRAFYLGGTFERLTGYPTTDFVGEGTRPIQSIFLSEDYEQMRREIAAGVAQNRVLSFDHRYRHRDGSVRWARVRARPVFDESGALAFLDGFVIDITKLMEAEQAARRALFFLDQSTDEAFWCGADGHFGYVNPAACRDLGYTREELLKMHVFDIAPNRRREEWPTFWERIKSRGHVKYETIHRRKDGAEIPVDLSLTFVRFEGQEYLYAFARDIRHRKQNEERLRESEERYRQAYIEIKQLRDQLEAENIYLREEMDVQTGFGNIVGESEAIRTTVQQIEMVAPTDSTVLILGESGTGKELVAHEIHKRSTRRDRPLIRVNCASIPKELYESEFFGHIKGAFTGAVRDRAGRFQLANEGTIFLDEVAEIPFELQGKLLRVLQEGEYERVGEEKTRSVNVRVIAATNKDLKREVEDGRFREDLYYRLNVFPIEIAPLRKRPNDIQILAVHLLAGVCRKMNRPVPRLTRANLQELERYDWPGNVREMQNVIERAVITARGGVIRFELPDRKPIATHSNVSVGGEGSSFLTELEMRERERDNIASVLAMTDGRIFGPDGAAALLGVKPTTLASRVKKLGLTRSDTQARPSK